DNFSRAPFALIIIGTRADIWLSLYRSRRSTASGLTRDSTQRIVSSYLQPTRQATKTEETMLDPMPDATPFDLNNYRPENECSVACAGFYDALIEDVDGLTETILPAFRRMMFPALDFYARDPEILLSTKNDERVAVLYEQFGSVMNDPFERFLFEIDPVIRRAYERAFRAVALPISAVMDHIGEINCPPVHHLDRAVFALLECAYDRLALLIEEDTDRAVDLFHDEQLDMGIAEAWFCDDGPGCTGPPPAHSTFDGFVFASADALVLAYVREFRPC
ncbi:MAG: hypothetical protein ABIG71_00070, partial [Candidatus Uhrbacteria bacterium]